jgi:hypothetical protein
VDIPSLAKNLYFQANGNEVQLSGININETQMSGNQAYTDMQKKRLKWKGVDDAHIVEPVMPKDLPNWLIALPAQRIRQVYV